MAGYLQTLANVPRNATNLRRASFSALLVIFCRVHLLT